MPRATTTAIPAITGRLSEPARPPASPAIRPARPRRARIAAPPPGRRSARGPDSRRASRRRPPPTSRRRTRRSPGPLVAVADPGDDHRHRRQDERGQQLVAHAAGQDRAQDVGPEMAVVVGRVRGGQEGLAGGDPWRHEPADGLDGQAGDQQQPHAGLLNRARETTARSRTRPGTATTRAGSDRRPP